MKTMDSRTSSAQFLDIGKSECRHRRTSALRSTVSRFDQTKDYASVRLGNTKLIFPLRTASLHRGGWGAASVHGRVRTGRFGYVAWSELNMGQTASGIDVLKWRQPPSGAELALRLVQETDQTQCHSPLRGGLGDMVGRSAAMQEIFASI